MVLRRDLDMSGHEVHHRVVAAAMSELELFHRSARRERHHLVPEADAEDGNPADKAFDLDVGFLDRIRIAGPVAEEYAVGLHGCNVIGRHIPRHDRHLASGARKPFEDGTFDTAVVGDDAMARRRSRSLGERMRANVGSEAAGRLAARRAHEVFTCDRGCGLRLGAQRFRIEIRRRDDGRLGACRADAAHERARIDAFDADDPFDAQIFAQGQIASPIRGFGAQVGDDESAQGRMRGLRIGERDAVVPDLRIGERNDLPGIGWVGDDLEIAFERGIEADLSERLARRAACAAEKDGAVGKRESRRTHPALGCRLLEGARKICRRFGCDGMAVG